MGVGNSKEEEARLASAIRKLSKVEIQRIEDVFHELSYVSNDGKRLIRRPTWLDREHFAEKFGLPDFLGEQLFAAFDRDQNQVVDMNEFLAGIALCLHGNIKDKCKLLFKIFNLDGDEGIKRDELTTVLTSSLQSARGVLTGYLNDELKGTVGGEMKITETVEQIVSDAFKTCDTSRNGRLEIEEFENWVHKNAKLIDSIFLISCPMPTEDPLNYDVIRSPFAEAGKFSFEEGNEISSDQDNRKQLNDLFDSQSILTKDTEGQSFFDTIGDPDDSMGISVSHNLVNDPTLTSTITAETVPPLEMGKDPISLTLEEPNIPVEAENILQNHLHTVLTKDTICSRNSEMSLVSLTQSTGDLSSLDESTEQTEGEKGPGEEGEMKKNIAEISEGKAPQIEHERNVDTGVGYIENQSATKLVLDLNLAPAPPEEGLPGVASPWHPLKPVFDVENHEGNDLFLDASDTIQTGTDSHISESESTNKGQTDDMHKEDLLAGERDLQSGLKPNISLQSDVNQSISTNTNLIPNDSSDSLIKTENEKDNFEEIPDAVIEDKSSSRPSNLDLGQTASMISVDLAPVDNALGKPTLRQLAEMKEFDKSPSLEDTNSKLPESRLAAWLPSLETRHLIDAVNRGVPADRTHLTNPSVLLETALGDPVKELVCRFLGEQDASKRPVPTADSVSMNDAGLKSLLASQCWRGAVDWTAKYLTAHGQGINTSSPSGSPTGLPFNHTPKLLQIWFVRIALLFKLRSFNSAEAELNAFGDFDKPDLFYEFYTTIYPGMKGSMVPFSLRVIHAELPQHNGRPQESLDRLYHLQSVIKNVLKNLENGLSEFGEETEFKDEIKYGAIQLWQAREIRILYAIGNCLLSIKEYCLAMKIFSEIIKKEPESKSAILSGVGRLHLQLGDIPLAKKYFRKVEHISLGDPKALTINVMNRGFVALAEGKYSEAFENFQSVTKLDPENSSAWNNASVSLLFQGKVKEACTLLETLIWKSPKRNLHEDIIFNLCTIYELETSRALQKKHKLLDLVCRYKGDGFNVQSLKLT